MPVSRRKKIKKMQDGKNVIDLGSVYDPNPDRPLSVTEAIVWFEGLLGAAIEPTDSTAPASQSG